VNADGFGYLQQNNNKSLKEKKIHLQNIARELKLETLNGTAKVSLIQWKKQFLESHNKLTFQTSPAKLIFWM